MRPSARVQKNDLAWGTLCVEAVDRYNSVADGDDIVEVIGLALRVRKQVRLGMGNTVPTHNTQTSWTRLTSKCAVVPAPCA